MIIASNKLPASTATPAADPVSDFAEDSVGVAPEEEAVPVDSMVNEGEVSEASADCVDPD